MSKAIVKHGAELAHVAGNVAEVMALLEGRPSVPEFFDLYCFCAVYDKPYTLALSGKRRAFSGSSKASRGTLPGGKAAVKRAAKAGRCT